MNVRDADEDELNTKLATSLLFIVLLINTIRFLYFLSFTVIGYCTPFIIDYFIL